MSLRKIYKVTEKELIRKCLSGDARAQHFLYEKYHPILYPICLRYTSDLSLAQDALMNAYLKIFEKLASFSHKGSFEGWMKRITVNETLGILRKRKRRREIYDDYERKTKSRELDEKLLEDDVLQLIESLPEGYRTVFNLYVIEGYKHKEIAEKLDISIHTSKSQLRMARKRLIELLEKINYPNIKNYKS